MEDSTRYQAIVWQTHEHVSMHENLSKSGTLCNSQDGTGPGMLNNARSILRQQKGLGATGMGNGVDGYM